RPQPRAHLSRRSAGPAIRSEGGPIEPEIRQGTPADADAIVSVTAAGWREGYRGIVSPEKLADLPIERWPPEGRVGPRRPVEDALTYVAEIEGGLAGYCYIAAPSREPDTGREVAEVGAMYVDPAHWSEGVGGALMNAALRRLAELPYSEAILWTFEQNERAVTF